MVLRETKLYGNQSKFSVVCTKRAVVTQSTVRDTQSQSSCLNRVSNSAAACPFSGTEISGNGSRTWPVPNNLERVPNNLERVPCAGKQPVPSDQKPPKNFKFLRDLPYKCLSLSLKLPR